jgi:hypothetical protein
MNYGGILFCLFMACYIGCALSFEHYRNKKATKDTNGKTTENL